MSDWEDSAAAWIAIQGESGGFYFPIMTCIIVSAVLSLLFWVAAKF